jgi:hypothetical protein
VIKIQKTAVILAVILAAAVFIFPIGAVQAQDQLPPSNPDQSWNPPEGAGEAFMAPGASSKFDSAPSSSTVAPGSSAPSSSFYPPPPGTPVSIVSANFIDDAGRVRSQLGNEPFYLKIQVNSPGSFYLAEYYPTGSGMAPQWLMYRYNLNRAGSWTLGPFYADTYEPVGQHTWKMWLYTAGTWAQRLIRFDYQPQVSPYPYVISTPVSIPETGSWSTLQVVIFMLLVGGLGITIGMLVAGRRRYSNP